MSSALNSLQRLKLVDSSTTLSCDIPVINHNFNKNKVVLLVCLPVQRSQSPTGPGRLSAAQLQLTACTVRPLPRPLGAAPCVTLDY